MAVTPALPGDPDPTLCLATAGPRVCLSRVFPPDPSGRPRSRPETSDSLGSSPPPRFSIQGNHSVASTHPHPMFLRTRCLSPRAASLCAGCLDHAGLLPYVRVLKRLRYHRVSSKVLPVTERQFVMVLVVWHLDVGPSNIPLPSLRYFLLFNRMKRRLCFCLFGSCSMSLGSWGRCF